MKNKIVQFAAIIDKIETLSDKSLKLKIVTSKEMEEVDKTILFSFHLKDIWLALKEQPVNAEDIKVKKETVDRGEKTPSQRLRAVLFVLWEQSKKTGDFDTFYKQKLEQFIDRVKENLDERN